MAHESLNLFGLYVLMDTLSSGETTSLLNQLGTNEPSFLPKHPTLSCVGCISSNELYDQFSHYMVLMHVT